jgi:hypothetical protein
METFYFLEMHEKTFLCQKHNVKMETLSFPFSPSWLLWLWRIPCVFFSGRSQIICTAAATWKNREMELETLTLVRAKSAEKGKYTEAAIYE